MPLLNAADVLLKLNVYRLFILDAISVFIFNFEYRTSQVPLNLGCVCSTLDDKVIRMHAEAFIQKLMETHRLNPKFKSVDAPSSLYY